MDIFILLTKIYFIIFLILLICKFFYDLFYLYKDVKLLNTECLDYKQAVRVIIFMPLLNEGHNFKKIISRFKPIINDNKNIKLVFVTTKREKILPNSKNTINCVKEFIAKLKKTELDKYVHIYYPRINLNLAQQLNFALKKIYKLDKNSSAKTYYGFYNADSNIDLRTIKCLFHLIEKHPNQKIFQQSSTFLQNQNNLKGLLGIILQANGLRQTRWTFLHEIPRYIKNNKDNLSLVHCVTHGLFIESKTMKKLGFFPTDSFGEDLYLGFIARASGYTVKPIPILESSDTPSSIISMLRQKYVWFWGPLGYFYYWVKLRRNMPEIWNKNKKIIIVTTILGIIDALNWLLSGWAFIIFIFFSYLLNQLPIGLLFSLLYLWTTTF